MISDSINVQSADHLSPLEKTITREPIVLPGSPFWKVFKRFGTDELSSLVVNVIGTAAMDYYLKSPAASSIATPIKNLMLACSGPVVEKAGFYAPHLFRAWDAYRTTPKDERDPLMTYVSPAMKEGTKSLIEDIIGHDPIYFGLMMGGLNVYPNAPAWMTSFVSFVLAVFGVSAGEVCVNELAYIAHKNAFKKVGFKEEKYYEARFLIAADLNLPSVLREISEKFSLDAPKMISYDDVYFDTNIPHYSGREPKLRLRRRALPDSDSHLQTVQLVFTRAAELSCKVAEQHRYFPIKKDKLYFELDQQMPETIDQIESLSIRRILKRTISDKVSQHLSQHISFDRWFSRNDQLLVSADKVYDANHRTSQQQAPDDSQPFFVLEVKAYNNTILLKQAMRHVMLNYPTLQTTYGKYELISDNRGDK